MEANLLIAFKIFGLFSITMSGGIYIFLIVKRDPYEARRYVPVLIGSFLLFLSSNILLPIAFDNYGQQIESQTSIKSNDSEKIITDKCYSDDDNSHEHKRLLSIVHDFISEHKRLLSIVHDFISEHKRLSAIVSGFIATLIIIVLKIKKDETEESYDDDLGE